MPSFVVTLAGLLIWQGVIQRSCPGVIVIQDNTINNFSATSSADAWYGRRLDHRDLVSAAYVAGTLGAALTGRRHGIPIRDPILLVAKLIAVPVVRSSPSGS